MGPNEFCLTPEEAVMNPVSQRPLAAPAAVLFDLDGTLLDTAPDLIAALQDVAAEEGKTIDPGRELRAVVTGGAAALLQAALDIAPHHGDYARLRERFLTLYAEGVARHTQLFPGMEAVLATLEERAIPWGIVTNKPKRFTEPLLAALGLHRRAACIVSGDSGRHSKPHPEPMLLACQQGGFAPWRCWTVGDAERDIRAGRWAGMTTFAAGYGYLLPDDEPGGWGAQAVLAQPEALLSYL